MIVGGSLSKSFFSEQYNILKFLRGITKTQGIRGLSLFLKVNSVSLQQAASGHRLDDLTSLGPRISRSKGGKLPRLIPANSRLIILNRGPGYEIIVKYYLTLFNIYRVLNFQGKLKLSTITNPGKSFDLKYFERYIPNFINLFVKQSFLKKMQMMFIRGFKFKSILKSSPTSSSPWNTTVDAKSKKIFSSHVDSVIEAFNRLKAPQFRELLEIIREFGRSYAFPLDNLFKILKLDDRDTISHSS